MLLALLLAALVPPRAFAHGGHQAAGMQTFTQMVGPYELAITVEFPLSVPAPLYLTLVSPQALTGATITFRAAPRGLSLDGAATAQVQGIDTPTIYFSELSIDRVGDWDIEVQASGPAGSGVARLPVTIALEPLPIASIALFAAIGTLILLMIASVLLSLIFQRRQRALPRWLNWVIGQGMFACIIVAVIFGIQQASAQIQSAANAASTAAGRPHANMVVETEPAAPVAGQPLTLTLDLSDGSTGLPIEDIVPHHEALLHLVILSADGVDFAHVHPARIGPGRYVIAFTPAQPGRYTAYAEIQRQDSGTQVITAGFEVGGAAAGPSPAGAARARAARGRRHAGEHNLVGDSADGRQAGDLHLQLQRRRRASRRPPAMARHGWAPDRPPSRRRALRAYPRGRADAAGRSDPGRRNDLRPEHPLRLHLPAAGPLPAVGAVPTRRYDRHRAV
jgi:hypothetical protein